MTSATLQFFVSMIGRCKGTTASSGLTAPIRTTNLNMTLASTSSGASQLNQVYGPQTRTLAGGASEELDLRSFTNALQETSQLFAEVRLFYLWHSSASLAATGIRIGNATANQWRPFQLATTGVLDLLPGEFIICGSPTTTGIAASAALRYLKVLNLEAAQVATYEVGFFGSIA